ncbi:MAG TPA: transposase [Candidatus Bathyarchaeia archaeon]|nr:transposase [Candidatus Bathyarchaeia archaeon]
MRKTEFASGEYYHIFNRGVDKRKIFQDESDFQRFWQSLILLNDERNGLMLSWRNCKRDRPGIDFKTFLQQESGSDRKLLVEIISYCLNPNHFHFILKQSKDDGIKKFMHKVGTSYANYFNERYDRTGALFEGRFKSIHIKNDSRLLYLVSYVSCNSEVHGISKASKYKWCSFSEYIGLCKDEVCDKKVILDQFRNRKDYMEFVRESVRDAKQKKEDEKSFLE